MGDSMDRYDWNKYKIAILIPCYNEQLTIRAVIEGFLKYLPNADIYVYDNNSTDNTYSIAKEAGAIVGKETCQGKGNVVRTMFERIDADIYVMADGDDTYPADIVHDLILPIVENEADMVVGDRLSNYSYQREARRGKLGSYGNYMFTKFVNLLFGGALKDIFSGYRAFSRKFVKTVPILSDGFQVEAEMTLFALDKKLKIKEIPINFKERPEGSESKLNTLLDGVRILRKVLRICKDYKPLLFFGVISFVFFGISLILGIPIILEFLRTGFVPRFPTAILCSSLMVLATLCFAIGLILNTVTVHSRAAYEIEFKRYQFDRQ